MTDEVNMIEERASLMEPQNVSTGLELEKQATESYNMVLSKKNIMERSQKNYLLRRKCYMKIISELLFILFLRSLKHNYFVIVK